MRFITCILECLSLLVDHKHLQPHGHFKVEEFYVNLEDEIKELDELNEGEDVNLETSEPIPVTRFTTSKEAEVENPFQDFKRPRRSKVWDDFLEPAMIKGKWKVRCKYCKSPLSILAFKSTTHLNRHLDTCSKTALHLKQQQMINFLPSDSSIGRNQSRFVSGLHNGKFDMLKMREEIAHWLTMHEHPFTMVEEEGFNLMMKQEMPQWTSVFRYTIRIDSFKVYDFEKKKLKALLKMVDQISLTTDLWWSGPQRIEYMVLTAHFVDLDWKLQKRVLNFVHLPPPRKGANIADCILTCLREWEIENKVSVLIFFAILILVFFLVVICELINHLFSFSHRFSQFKWTMQVQMIIVFRF